MNDHHEIKNLVHHYCDRVCHNDQESWLELWADDGVWNIGRGPVRGKTEIRAAMASSMNLFESVIQVALNGTATTNELEGRVVGISVSSLEQNLERHFTTLPITTTPTAELTVTGNSQVGQ